MSQFVFAAVDSAPCWLVVPVSAFRRGGRGGSVRAGSPVQVQVPPPHTYAALPGLGWLGGRSFRSRSRPRPPSRWWIRRSSPWSCCPSAA